MTGPIRLNVNQSLALAAFVLGALAVFARPAAGPRASIDPQEFALAAARGADEVQPAELADWIIAGRGDYRLLDLRGAADYAAYHIPGAEHVPLVTLPHAEIARTEKVVVYSRDGVPEAQACVLLRAQGVRATYLLAGGLEGWKRSVLFPVLKPGATRDDEQANERARAIAERFGGQAVVTTGAPTAGAPAPPREEVKLPPPPPPVAAAAAPRPAKKKEGC